MRNKLEFLNRNGEKFDWENDNLAEIEVKAKEKNWSNQILLQKFQESL